MKRARQAVCCKLGVMLAITGCALAATDGSSAPAVIEIENNYGLIPQGLPNWGIAPGSILDHRQWSGERYH